MGSHFGVFNDNVGIIEENPIQRSVGVAMPVKVQHSRIDLPMPDDVFFGFSFLSALSCVRQKCLKRRLILFSQLCR